MPRYSFDSGALIKYYHIAIEHSVAGFHEVFASKSRLETPRGLTTAMSLESPGAVRQPDGRTDGCSTGAWGL
jgi:hypothetical protein